MQLLKWFFREEAESPKTVAKARMRSMIVNDRLELPAGRLEILEEELLAVVSRYFELDRDTTHFDLQQSERKAAFIANFRLLRSKC